MHKSDGAFHGLELDLRSYSGAKAVRVVHPERQLICEHVHDWPCLTLPVIGSYIEQFEGRRVHLTGPCAVIHPAGHSHANSIGETGLETVSIQFDPAWLGSGRAIKIDRPRSWTGGRIGRAASRLAAAWTNPGSAEEALAQATSEFISFAYANGAPVAPAWLKEVEGSLHSNHPPDTSALAARLGLHPAWLARAYRWATGEGLQETLRRRRVERAVALLRSTNMPLSEVAPAVGFFDQSHMSRGFQKLLGRTPLRVRSERGRLAPYRESTLTPST